MLFSIIIRWTIFNFVSRLSTHCTWPYDIGFHRTANRISPWSRNKRTFSRYSTVSKTWSARRSRWVNEEDIDFDRNSSLSLKECHEHGGYLAYWIANTSELLYFIKQDRDISKISHDLQDRLAECVQRLFRYLTHLVQNELDKYLISFTNPQDDVERDVYIAFGKSCVFDSNEEPHDVLCSEENGSTNVKLSDARWVTLESNGTSYHQPTLGDILATLSSIMDLLRKCRVNAALTIQMFSQIFHYINTWLFNRIVCCPELKLCAHFWGEKLSQRLKSISDWAQRQGLELASDCHLTKVNQICLLLQSTKRDPHDVQQLIANNTFKLNSIQLTQILNNYVLNRNEPPISATFSQA